MTHHVVTLWRLVGQPTPTLSRKQKAHQHRGRGRGVLSWLQMSLKKTPARSGRGSPAYFSPQSVAVRVPMSKYGTPMSGLLQELGALLRKMVNSNSSGVATTAAR
jgi:hypothetical protein